ncbi:MAG TPA: SH3 domain-containing protein [Blastocatellia bacterium]|nr:SH3 domain-containing protein [Blastocatellia bacterium]
MKPRFFVEYDNKQFNSRASMRRDYSSRFSDAVVLAAMAVLIIFLAWIVLPLRTASHRPETVPKEPPITRDTTSAKHVTLGRLYLRENPSNSSAVSQILSRGMEVILLGEAHIDLDGNVWLRVIVETRDGRQIGWAPEHSISNAKRDIH